MQLGFSESSEIFSFLQNSEIFKFAEGNTELLPVISVGMCLKALILIENLHHPSETNRKDNYGCW